MRAVGTATAARTVVRNDTDTENQLKTKEKYFRMQ